jgi:protein TonB
MAITLSVIILISLVSFYDYFSARKWQQVTSSTRNDIVFANRNKEYGAYEIRKNYDKKVVLILASLCLIIGTAFAVHKYIQSIPEPVVEEAEIDMTQFDLPAEALEEEVPPPIEEPPPPMEETLAFPEPVIVDEIVENTIAIDEEVQETKAAETTQEGTDEFVQPVEEVAKVAEVEKPEVIETEVDEDPEFPGGEAARIAFLQKNIIYPQIAIEEGLSGKTWIGFVVDRSGAITNVQVLKKMPGCPECDKEAMRVVKMMPKYKPGKKNGKDVKCVYRTAINYSLQN